MALEAEKTKSCLKPYARQPMPSKETQTFTYQARLQVEASSDQVLDECAHLLSCVERNLFAHIAAGKNAADLKSPYLKKYGITARHFNAVRVQLEGKIASIREKQHEQIFQTQDKIASAKKRVQQLEKRCPSKAKLHQKKRLLFNLERKLEQLQSDQEAGKISLCFGSRRLFRAQFDLIGNGYQSHEEWLADWRHSRKSHFFLLGSKDESSGNQSCTATLEANGNVTLRIRLPDCLAKAHGKYLFLSEVYFQYGHQEIVKALKSCEERKRLQTLKNPHAVHYGVPISYRFKKDEKGWRVFASLPVEKSSLTTSSRQGVIGIDINANHLAIAETDRFGNPIAKRSIPLNTYGKDRNQAKALIGDACASLVAWAKKKEKTLVIENLDFQKKKTELKEQKSPSHARMLSSLAYSHIKNILKSRAWREGVEVVGVNPAFTSVIGRIKFSKRYGLSIHQAAGLAIGRRHLKASERVPRHLESIPDGKGDYVALSLPVRNRDKHVWSTWRILNQELKTVLAAHFRAKHDRSSSSQPTPEIETIPNFVGEIPTRESVNTTARLTCLDISTTVFV
jgi:IS605 OrfB family transposase